MEAKLRKTIRLSEKEYCMIESIQKEQKLPDFSKTLSYILHEYSKKEEDNCRLREHDSSILTHSLIVFRNCFVLMPSGVSG